MYKWLPYLWKWLAHGLDNLSLSLLIHFPLPFLTCSVPRRLTWMNSINQVSLLSELGWVGSMEDTGKEYRWLDHSLIKGLKWCRKVSFTAKGFFCVPIIAYLFCSSCLIVLSYSLFFQAPGISPNHICIPSNS